MSEETFRRVGVLVGDADPIVEYDLQRFLPHAVAFHIGRLDMPSTPRLSASESLKMMVESAPRAALKVALAEPEFFLFACTSAGFFSGPGRDLAVAESITQATGLPAISAATAVIDALGLPQRASGRPFWVGRHKSVRPELCSCRVRCCARLK